MEEETTFYGGGCSAYPVVQVVSEGLYTSSSLPTTSNIACNYYVPGSTTLLKQLFLRRGNSNIFTVADMIEPGPRRSHRTGCVLEAPRSETHSWASRSGNGAQLCGKIHGLRGVLLVGPNKENVSGRERVNTLRRNNSHPGS